MLLYLRAIKYQALKRSTVVHNYALLEHYLCDGGGRGGGGGALDTRKVSIVFHGTLSWSAC